MPVEKLSQFVSNPRVRKWLMESTEAEHDGSELEQLGVVLQDSRLSNAGMLCFGTSVSSAFPGACTRCIVWRGAGRDSGSEDDIELHGDLLAQFRKAVDYITKNLRIARRISISGRRDVLEIPAVALEEAVANALIHRDYQMRTEAVIISVFTDRIEIISPGLLPPPLTVNSILSAATSHPRNPIIARIFYLAGIVEKAGSGIERILASLQGAGLPDPLFKETEDHCLKLIMARPGNRSGFRSATSDLWEINAPPDAEIIGRELVVNSVREFINVGQWNARMLIFGACGMGKTAIASKAFAYAVESGFGWVHFISCKSGAETASSSVSGEYCRDYRSIVQNLYVCVRENLDLPPEETNEPEDSILAAMANRSCLLILDDADLLDEPALRLLSDFFGRMPATSKVLITSLLRLDLPFNNVHELTGLDRQAVFDLAHSKATQVSQLSEATEAEKTELWTWSDGNPAIVNWAIGKLGIGGIRRLGDLFRICESGQHVRPGDTAPMTTVDSVIAELNSIRLPYEIVFGEARGTLGPSEVATVAMLRWFSTPIHYEKLGRILNEEANGVLLLLRKLRSRYIVKSSELDQEFFIAPIIANCVLFRWSTEVDKAGDLIESFVFTLLESYSNPGERFELGELERWWDVISVSLERFFTGSSARLQFVCRVLFSFLSSSQRYADGIKLCSDAAQRAMEDGDLQSAGWRFCETGWFYYYSKNGPMAMESARQAESCWDSEPERAKAIRLRWHISRLTGNADAMIAASNDFIELSLDETTRPYDIIMFTMDIASASRSGGELAGAERDYWRAHKLAKEHSYPKAEAACMANLALIAADRGGWELAEVRARHGIRLAEAGGFADIELTALRVLVRTLNHQGRVAESADPNLRIRSLDAKIPQLPDHITSPLAGGRAS